MRMEVPFRGRGRRLIPRREKRLFPWTDCLFRFGRLLGQFQVLRVVAAAAAAAAAAGRG